jgi:hypothetical protein
MRQVIFHAHNAGFTSFLDMLFGYVVCPIKRHRKSKDEVKPAAATRFIMCRVDGITHQVIFHAHNVGFTSSLDMLFVLSSVREVAKTR